MTKKCWRFLRFGRTLRCEDKMIDCRDLCRTYVHLKLDSEASNCSRPTGVPKVLGSFSFKNIVRRNQNVNRNAQKSSFGICEFTHTNAEPLTNTSYSKDAPIIFTVTKSQKSKVSSCDKRFYK